MLVFHLPQPCDDNIKMATDLLLADVVLPGMSGRDLAAEFKSLCPRARILLMSGHAEQLVGSGLSRHGKNCLAKPFSTRTLLSRVREVLSTNPSDAGSRRLSSR